MLIALFLAGAVVSTSAFLEDFFNNDIFNSKNCTANQFRCNSYDCIDKKQRCDGIAQCGDLSDEKNCDLYLCTEPNYFKCKNKRCIAKSFVCDGQNDCEDFSDEINCRDFQIKLSVNTTCQSGEWQCTDHLCIPEEWVCNGEDDCLDGSDEGLGCSKDIECDGFKCKNHHCIPNEWQCDSHDDCGDNSDEQNCEHHFNINECILENRKFLCTDKQNCLDIHRVCDGKADCLDKSDEAQMCANSKKTCLNAGCSHDCVKLPSGPVCLCPVGYHKLDKKTCIDINECEQYDICDQRCRNTQGSYQCYCDSKYELQDDKKSCKAVGGEATMIFSSKNRIRSYLLTSDLYFPVADDLKQVVGVDYDGSHVYWTDVFAEHESIVRSSEDGSERELIVTSGLSLPEDIAVDWLTKNIYFTDIQKRHIGVCNNDGTHCTVLVNDDVRKPRAIVLNVNDGTMYWTDWEKPAEIAYAEMDGSNHRPFLKDDIHWPNGLALDYPNSRLYWTDAKKMTLESIRLDGTDRRVVLKGIAKHPFSISVFESKLYWSDWETKSIQVCDKFSGKEHRTLIKEDKEFVYGISIFHSALHERSENPCSLAFCTDICLLKANGYSCACSEGRVLSNDRHTCKDIVKKQMIVGATNNYLLRIEHKALGRHIATVLPSIVKNAGSITYDGQNNTLYVSDLDTKRIVSLNMHTYDVKHLPVLGLGKITSMDYDPAGNNLFMCDTEKATLEVISLTTMSRKVLIHDFQDEIPQSVAVVPEEGVLFIAITNKVYESAHIDRMYMDGTGRTHVIENGLVGPISLHYDSQMHRVFFSDGGTGDIESTSVEGDDRHVFRSLHSIPVDITTLNSDLFWVNKYSRRLYWSDKQNGEFNQKITLDIPSEIDQIHLASVTPTKTVDSPCQVKNGNCSHLCLPIHKSVVCACPSLMSLDSDQKTCVHRLVCDEDQFKCPLSRSCVAKKLRCDGKKDCHHGEDEEECQKERTHCPSSSFQCNDGACISEDQVCDHHYDCKDKSDEHNCHSRTNKQSCPPDHFRCGNDRCIADRFVCDGANDCNDNSDEENCLSTTCADSQFRCDSGTCIPKSWECDHEYDCQDFSDEHAGCVTEGCDSNMFQCSNGKCLDKKLVCDYSDDCGDHSDEQNCYSHRLEDSCEEGQFSCTSKPLCLNITARCNGTFECPGHEDERDCSNCGEENFECKNKKCVPIQWLCDGSDDCGDHSDEDKDLCKAVDHKSMPQPPSDHVPCNDGFRCKTGACVNLTALCDKNHDCYDGSDEDGLCSRSCDTLHNPCDHKCLRTPVGPMCHCKPGFRLMGDGHSCLDVNECEQESPVCSQLCVNQEGSYMCDCYEGFMLRPDKKSCKAEGAPMSLIYTTDNQIRQLTQKSNSLTVLYSEEMPKITSLTVDMKTMTIYFTLDHSNTIQRINLNSKKREYMEHLGQPQRIAYDWATGHIYYFNAQSDTKSISVCNFDDMQCGKLIDIDVHRYVSELTVDSVNKVMFYSLTSWWIFNSPSYVLYKVNLDGTEQHEMVRSSSGYITGLTFDSNKKTLYYMDQHQGQIMSINYEDSASHVLFSNLTRPSGLKFFENNLYYATISGKINKCQVYGAKECDSFKIHSYALQHFTIVQDGLQPPVKNVCEDHKCSYLCIANKIDYSCLCEDGRVVEKNQECGSVSRTSFNDHRPEFHSIDLPSDDSSGKSNGAVTSVVVITFMILIIGACLFIYAKRRNHGTFNISMRFTNPSYDKHVDEFENPILSNDGKVEFTNETFESLKKQDGKISEKVTPVNKDVRFCITEPSDTNEDETVNFLDL